MYKLVSTKKLEKKYEVSFLMDDEFYNFKISEDLLIEFKLFPPKSLDEETYKKFLNRLPFDSVLLEGLKYAIKGAKTKKQIKDHLLEFTSSEMIVNEVMDNLSKKNLINDEYIYSNIVDYLVNYKMDGRYKILNKLNEVGLDYIKFTYDEEDLKRNINNLTIKYQSKLKENLSIDEKIDKSKKYLYQKGYSEQDINKYFNIKNVL